VVDAYDLPTAEADLAVYRTQFGLPPCTTANGCFQKVDQNGGTSYPIANAGWAAEIALDMDMVSAACPNCNILLVEANDAQFYNLGPAVNTAVSLGAMAVSNSYGGYEWSGETLYDTLYYDHPGVAITVSTGDCGYHCSGVPGNYVNSVEYPSASPYVVAVGGTSLTRDTSARGWTESAWGHGLNSASGAGSGCSDYETKPTWQQDTGCANRMQADVSAVADPSTGVAVYVSGDWSVYGGTSAASPIIAAVYALAGAPAAGTYPASYLYGDTADLYDVTSGSSDIWEPTIVCTVFYLCNGVAGYDGPTGLGTPNGVNAFIAPGAAMTLAVSGIANPYVAGAAQSVTVTAVDAYGNVAVGYLGTVQFTSSDTRALLPAAYTFTALDAGVHTFSVTLKTAGSQGVRATDTVTATITGAQYIVVTPAAATTLVVSGLTSPRTAGVAGIITVTARDAFGNTATGYRGTIGFTSADTKATLPANYTFTAANKGVHTFSVTLKTAGNQSVRARDIATSTITGGQYPILVTPAAATTLVVSGLGSPRTAGIAGYITVTARDAYGNTAIGYRGTVHFTSTDTKALLPANYKFTAANKGVHTFKITLKTRGTQSVRARDTVTSTITGVQSGIVVR